MNIVNLELYVETQNVRAERYGQETLSLFRQSDRREIADFLASDLDPENLLCDGERSPRAAQAAQSFLIRCIHELGSLGFLDADDADADDADDTGEFHPDDPGDGDDPILGG